MIPLRNVYYMLAYSFSVLMEKGYRDIAAEDFENAAELLAAILCRGVSMLLKRGLGREYITNIEPLSTPRGKLEISESVKTQAIRKKQLVCAYDEFSVNSYLNRIIKTTMERLLRSGISKKLKKEIRKLLIFFDGVETLDIHRINWNVRYDRNNQTYQMIISVCELIIDDMLQSETDGSTRVMDYRDARKMSKLYEKFILGYFRREHPDIKAHAPMINWKLDDGNADSLLPVMETDIVLTNSRTRKTLIIDAKYYSHNLQTRLPYMTKSLVSANLYQLFTYVKNWPAAEGETVSGMLLYARTDDDLQPDNDYMMSGNKISAKTLDLNGDFTTIAAQLDAVAETVKQ